MHTLKMNEDQLLQNCLQGDRKAQRQLYDRFSRTMMGVCLRYSENRQMAEDVLQDGFIQVFQKLETFKGEGSLEGWIRRIMVNTALNHFRHLKKQPLNMEILPEDSGSEVQQSAIEQMSAKELVQMIQSMPEGYRTVFNMYAIEGFNHKEIGQLLGISAGTSKSQYSRAKIHLQKMIDKELIENER